VKEPGTEVRQALVWDGITRPTTPSDVTAEARQQLGECARRYNWKGVFEALEADSLLINSSRPGSASRYAPLHQAAHGGAPVDVVMRLIALGAWCGLRNAAGERPLDVARRRNHTHLLRILEPPRHIDVAPEVLRRIQVYFHAVIRVRAQHLVDEHALRLPELEVMLEMPDPHLFFALPPVHSGFWFRLEPAGPNSRLVAESSFHSVDNSYERHTITASGVTQRRTKVGVPDDGADPDEFIRFAQTYNGYALHGDDGELTRLTLPLRQRWERTGELSADVDVLRACLFFEQRSHDGNGGRRPFDKEPFVAALVTHIRRLSGGSVPLRAMSVPHPSAVNMKEEPSQRPGVAVTPESS
jgi:hypothetical protein